MKKLITSAGLAVLGAASMNAQQIYAPAPGLTTTQLSKPWSVSAAIRGFYDDNYALTPSSGLGRPSDRRAYRPARQLRLRGHSLGRLELGDGADVHRPELPLQLQVFRRAPGHIRRSGPPEPTFKLSHTFSDRYKLDLADSFVSTSEPDLIAPVNAPNATLRTRQDVLRNYGTATFTAGLTDQLSALIGYANTLYDFEDSGAGSLSALLDRMEHLGTINLRWQALPSTVGILGYQMADQQLLRRRTDGDSIRPGITRRRPTCMSDERNNYLALRLRRR